MYIYQKIISSWWKQISYNKLHFFANFNMLCMNLVQSRYYQLQYIGFAKVMAQLAVIFIHDCHIDFYECRKLHLCKFRFLAYWRSRTLSLLIKVMQFKEAPFKCRLKIKIHRFIFSSWEKSILLFVLALFSIFSLTDVSLL